MRSRRRDRGTKGKSSLARAAGSLEPGMWQRRRVASRLQVSREVGRPQQSHPRPELTARMIIGRGSGREGWSARTWAAPEIVRAALPRDQALPGHTPLFTALYPCYEKKIRPMALCAGL